MNYIPLIGIEIHVELKTKSKMFSSAPSLFGERENTLTLPFDLSFPGTLPVVNKEAVRQGIQVCHALHMKIDHLLRFDRKNYFYPDLPKGYQITQQYHPIGKNGYVKFICQGEENIIRLDNAHLEEDTAKQIHQGKYSYLNFNRCGTPLLEIVSCPELHSPVQAMKYVETIRDIVTYLGVSDGKMENGSLRCDINISLMEEDSSTFGTKTEIKNLNTIQNIQKALEYEIQRQRQLLENHQEVESETRRFDEKTQKTVLMRKKNEEVDYEYYPEANIPPISLSRKFISDAIKESELLPDQYRENWKDLNLTPYQIDVLLKDKLIARYFQSCLAYSTKSCSIICNYLISEIPSFMKKQGIQKIKLNPKDFVLLCDSQYDQKITSKQAKGVISSYFLENKEILTRLEEMTKNPSLSNTDLVNVTNKVIQNNPQSVSDYLSGKEKALSYLVGQVLKETQGRADPNTIKAILMSICKKDN